MLDHVSREHGTLLTALLMWTWLKFDVCSQSVKLWEWPGTADFCPKEVASGDTKRQKAQNGHPNSGVGMCVRKLDRRLRLLYYW